MDRREMIVGGGLVITGAAALEGCGLFTSGGTDAVTWVQNLLNELANIQSEVRSRLAGVCTTANSMVPSIDMALEALKAALGVTTIGSGVTILATAVEAAVNGIVAAGCPPAPAPTATLNAPAGPPPTITINGKQIPAKWV